MKTVRTTAALLYYLTRAASFLFLLTALYMAIVVYLSHHTHVTGVPIEIKDNTFIIFYPFTKTPFLLGDYTTPWIITTLLTITLYGIFLWLLSSVFAAFKQPRLFTQANVSRLQRFYIFNLCVPVLCIAALAVFGQEIRDALVIVFLHIMIGVFAFFMATIFKQGLLLQEEQDLTL